MIKLKPKRKMTKPNLNNYLPLNFDRVVVNGVQVDFENYTKSYKHDNDRICIVYTNGLYTTTLNKPFAVSRTNMKRDMDFVATFIE